MITVRPRPVCPMCREYGIHPNVDGCLEALRAARDLFDLISRASCQAALAEREIAERRVARYLDYTRSIGRTA